MSLLTHKPRGAYERTDAYRQRQRDVRYAYLARVRANAAAFNARMEPKLPVTPYTDLPDAKTTRRLLQEIEA